MKVKVSEIKVHKEAGIMVVHKRVPLYEVSVLRLVHGSESVEVLNNKTDLSVEVESAEEEYRRLGDLYGSNKKRNTKFVELIFGFYETGQFEKAFADSLVSNKVEAPAHLEVEEKNNLNVFTKKDGSPFKRAIDLVNALKKNGLEGQYATIEVEDGFIGSPA